LKNREKTKEQLIKELEELWQTNEFFSLLLESMPFAVYTCEVGGDFGATYISNNITALTGYKPDDFTSDSEFWFHHVHPDDQEMVNLNLVTLMETGSITYEYRWRVADGSYKWFYDTSRLMKSPDGETSFILGSWVDITDRKNAEKQIRQSLKEKEILLKEIHHRVKNNLTVVSSLLMLQADKVKDEQYKTMFNESINRVRTMASIHEKLYQSEDLANIDLSAYIKDLAENTFTSYGSGPRIKLITDIQPVTLGIDASIPCGLIVNELITNSMKYGFPEERDGEIKLSLSTNDRGEIELTVSDNGVGMPEEMDFRNAGSLVQNIVNALVKQLQGKMEFNKENETMFKITFRRR